MKRIFALAVIISVISIASIAIVYAQCPADKVAITKSGCYGAITTDKYDEMNAAIKKNDQAGIRSLMAEKSGVKNKKIAITPLDRQRRFRRSGFPA